MTTRDILLTLSVKYNGDWEKIYTDISSRKSLITEKEIKQARAKIKCNFITFLDKEYPESLRKSQKPPFVLYYYGDLSLINNTKKHYMIGGVRDLDSEEIKQTAEISMNLPQDTTIVSGLSRGTQFIANTFALSTDKKVVCVLPSGINNIYPHNEQTRHIYEQIKHNGLVLSEYPNETPPAPNQFLMRNRIIVSLCDKIILTSFTKKSNIFVTVSYALEEGKEVWAVPYPFNADKEINRLIADGATPLLNLKDLED